MSDPLDDPRFGDGPAFALGVEEELLLCDPGTGALRNAREQVLDGLGDVVRGEVTGEVHACEVECITDVCETVGEAMGVLADLRRAVLATGVGIVGTATHPTADEDAAEITDHERYRFIAEHLGDALVTPVAAVHLHVGMPDAETAVRVFNGLRRHLPLIEAVAANSPFRHGRDTGFASARELALRAWARSGAPRAFADYDDFAAFARRLTRAAGTPDYTYHWFKLRPHPRLGTVEIRSVDAQSSLEHVGALTALVHALAHHEAHADPTPGPDPEILAEASYRAGRSGLAAQLPGDDGTLRPVADVLEETLSLAQASAEHLGCATELAALPALAGAGGGAGLQRADHEAGGFDAVLQGLLERTRPEPVE